MLHSLPLLAIIVATLLLYPLLFKSVFLVLSLQVTFQLAELGFYLVFTILADHLNGSESLLSLFQFVLFLLFGTSGLLNINTLVDSTAISLSHLNIILMASLCPRSSRSTRVHHSEG